MVVAALTLSFSYLGQNSIPVWLVVELEALNAEKIYKEPISFSKCQEWWIIMN